MDDVITDQKVRHKRGNCDGRGAVKMELCLMFMSSSSVLPAHTYSYLLTLSHTVHIPTHIQKVCSQILCGLADLSSRDPIDPIKAPVSTDRVTPGGGVGGGGGGCGPRDRWEMRMFCRLVLPPLAGASHGEPTRAARSDNVPIECQWI